MQVHLEDPPARPAIERFRELMDEAPWNASIKDPEGHYLYLYRHYLATLGDRFGADWYGKTNADIWPLTTRRACARSTLWREAMRHCRCSRFSGPFPTDPTNS